MSATEKLTKRFELLVGPKEFHRWERRARELELPSVSAYLRRIASEDMTKAKTEAAR